MPGDYEKAITIEKAIQNIVNRRYLLPAIQRKFTWSSDQICVLFDSIMRGYPINSFMFWEVKDAEVKKSFRFYQFLERYCERFEENNPDFDTKGHGDFHAVIDGQQRLTSMYIGLKGTYAYKLPRKWWPKFKDDTILPPRRLYLALHRPLDEDENEEMMSFDFQFLTVEEFQKKSAEQSTHWFDVGAILDFPEIENYDDVVDIVLDYLEKHELTSNSYARKTLMRLYFAIRRDPIIHYYNETNQQIDHVLDIFIRTNHGGTPLSFSDLLMSIAVANWKKDARQQIDDLVDAVRFGHDMEFSIDRDFVLKTCLMVTGKDVRFKVKNFNKEKVDQIEKEWDDIKQCILATFKLIRAFGLNDAALRAKNAAIPISYYLYHKGRDPENCKKGLYTTINNRAYHAEDRKIISKWLNMSLLKGVFGGQTDALLAKLQNEIKENLTGQTFPLAEIVRAYKGTNKDLSFDDEFIARLLTTQKEDASCFSILSLLFPDLDFTRVLDKDHLHPASDFSSGRLDKCNFLTGNAELRAFYENPENWNSIANLHLLDASLNRSRQDEPLVTWLNREDIPLKKGDLLLPEEVKLEFSEFKEFFISRSNYLKDKLKALI